MGANISNFHRMGFLYAERAVFLGTLASVFVLGLVLAGIVCFLSPRQYESRCVAEPGAMPGLTIGATDPDTVCAIMLSKRNLAEVDKTLDLSKRWGYDAETSGMILRGITTARVQPNGKLVEVLVRHRNSGDARDIAAGVVGSWGRHMRDEVREYRTRSIALAASKAEIHRLNTEEYEKELAACLARKPENQAVPEGIRRKLERERSLEKAMREEESRLVALLETQFIPLVIHEEPVASHKPVSPDVSALFARWTVGALLAGACLAIPAAALSRHLRIRCPAGSRLDLNATPEPNW